VTSEHYNFEPVLEEQVRTAHEIAQVLRRNILDDSRGPFNLKDRILPPVAFLANHFSVSPTTIRRAEKILADTKLVVISPGRRTRITDGPHNALTEIQYELTSVINDLDRLRDRIGALQSLINPYLKYRPDDVELQSLNEIIEGDDKRRR